MINKTGRRVFLAMRSDPKQINVKTGQGSKVTYDPSKNKSQRQDDITFKKRIPAL